MRLLSLSLSSYIKKKDVNSLFVIQKRIQRLLLLLNDERNMWEKKSI